MRKISLAIAGAVLVLLSRPGLAQDRASGATAEKSRQITILVSIDGFRAEYLDRGITPNLTALAVRGVRARMQPSFPSVTFPNHYTLLTGKVPDHHGIVGNRFEDETGTRVFGGEDRADSRNPRWWNGAVPLWATAEAQGIGTAHFFWLTTGVDRAGKPPARYRPYDPKLPVGEEPGELLKWLDAPAPDQPRFLTLYFYPVDHEGHDHGTHSPELEAALRQVDSAIGTLVEGLRQRGLLARTNIVVVSDHGMTDVPRDHVVMLDDLVKPGTFRTISLGAYATVDAANGIALKRVSKRLVGRHGHVECWRREALPARFHYGANARIAPIVCLADKGWNISTRAERAKSPPRDGPVFGDHGFDPADPDMAAIFIAAGPAFRHGVRLPPFDNVDVYPLLADVIGVTPQPGDGSIRSLLPALAEP
ncbi:MAG: ectonucleotide pyrophosphatase/phosphodiesterase [Sphingomonadales bacterium]